MDASNDQLSFLKDDASSSEREVSRKKKYHRHTPDQIQKLETSFKECLYPNEKQRAALSRRLGLVTRQVNFWFQNKRTQLKAQSEQDANKLLKQQNEKLRAENDLLQHAYANLFSQSCGGIAVPTSMSLEHERLWNENVKLKHELQQLNCLITGQPSFSLLDPEES